MHEQGAAADPAAAAKAQRLIQTADARIALIKVATLLAATISRCWRLPSRIFDAAAAYFGAEAG